jgi:hypothetical protein
MEAWHLPKKVIALENDILIICYDMIQPYLAFHSDKPTSPFVRRMFV